LERAYRSAHLSEMSSPTEREEGSYEWKPIRHHLGVSAFGVNAFVAPQAGDQVVEEHTEIQENAARHEELYFVASGRARFTIAGDELEAPAGTCVLVADPAARRSAVALEPGTTVLAVGAEPGAPYAVSGWERKYFDQ